MIIKESDTIPILVSAGQTPVLIADTVKYYRSQYTFNVLWSYFTLGRPHSYGSREWTFSAYIFLQWFSNNNMSLSWNRDEHFLEITSYFPDGFLKITRRPVRLDLTYNQSVGYFFTFLGKKRSRRFPVILFKYQPMFDLSKLKKIYADKISQALDQCTSECKGKIFWGTKSLLLLLLKSTFKDYKQSILWKQIIKK